MPYAEVGNYQELARAIARASAEGSASLTVPFFGANSGAFDAAVEDGLATGYVLLVELSLPRPEGVGQ